MRNPLCSVWHAAAVWTAFCGFAPCLTAQDAPQQDKQEQTPADPWELPPARTEYMGRRIARTMHFSGAPWLIRQERQIEEDTAAMIKALAVKPGQTVCDLGCGNGYHTLKMAELVGRQGRVLAVDIQEEMLDLLEQRAKRKGLTNIGRIHSTVVDPKLPEGEIDLVLLVDVYHEFSHPELMLRAIRKSLRPEGQVVLVEFRAEDPEVPIRPLHKMSREQVLKELEANGFTLAREFTELPWQHMLFFSRSEGESGDPACGCPPRQQVITLRSANCAPRCARCAKMGNFRSPAIIP